MSSSARRGGSGGIGHLFSRALMFLVLTGFALAVLRIFNWDPFGIIEWAWDSVSGVVTRIADWFTDNGTFRKIFGRPDSA